MVLTGCSDRLKRQPVRPLARSAMLTDALAYTSPSSDTTTATAGESATLSADALALLAALAAAAAAAGCAVGAFRAVEAAEPLAAAACFAAPLRVAPLPPEGGRCCCSCFWRCMRAAVKGAGSGRALLSCTCSWMGVLLHSCSSCCLPTSAPKMMVGVANVAARTDSASLSWPVLLGSVVHALRLAAGWATEAAACGGTVKQKQLQTNP